MVRFDPAALDLVGAGFRVPRVPAFAFAFDDKTYFAYADGGYETRGGREVAWFPPFGAARLDDEARRVHERLSWEVRPLAGSAAYSCHGTIGSLVNVLARRARLRGCLAERRHCPRRGMKMQIVIEMRVVV